MTTKGIVIGGLAMAAAEFPNKEGFRLLDNPGVNGEPDLTSDYSLEDVADFHANKIRDLQCDSSFVCVGMSMGGMILSILASKYRSIFPDKTQFLYLVTSANTPKNQAVPDYVVKKWFQVHPGNIEEFKNILSPFFSRGYLATHPKQTNEYFEYRANSKNKQSTKSFVNQLNALKKFKGEQYFSSLNPQESTFIGGAEDYVLGPSHNKDLVRLLPDATHKEIVDLGHMLHLEKPEIMSQWVQKLKETHEKTN